MIEPIAAALQENIVVLIVDAAAEKDKGNLTRILVFKLVDTTEIKLHKVAVATLKKLIFSAKHA